MENNLSHINDSGAARMVDVSAKSPTLRRATAEGYVLMAPATLAAVRNNSGPKGEVLSVARIAGIQAAKKTGDLIPLCHPLPLEQVTVDFELLLDRLRILASATITAKTGIEMEAFTAVSVAALTIIDMLKAIDPAMQITGIRLLEKTGGKSHYIAK
ncbi:MAG: cyclic pyranopterin monophosphate synthase MoaC [Phycisphaerae bacterium]